MKLAEIQNTGFPKDLRLVLSTHDLLCKTYGAVEATTWFRDGSCPPGSRTKMLRTLLTYAYASGIYASEEIVSATTVDGPIGYIARGHNVTSQELRHFRRLHTSELSAALGLLLTEAMDAPGIQESEVAMREAHARLQTAIGQDSAWLDV